MSTKAGTMPATQDPGQTEVKATKEGKADAEKMKTSSKEGKNKEAKKTKTKAGKKDASK